MHFAKVDADAAFNSVDAAFDGSSSAEGHNWNLIALTDFENVADFFGGMREADGVWKSGRMIGLADAVLLAQGERKGEPFPEDGGEVGDSLVVNPR